MSDEEDRLIESIDAGKQLRKATQKVVDQLTDKERDLLETRMKRRLCPTCRGILVDGQCKSCGAIP